MQCLRRCGPVLGSLLLTAVTNPARAQQWRLHSPGAVEAAASCYDPVREVMVMFGGSVSSATPVRDGSSTTWEWQGTNWTRVGSNLAAPPRRYGAAIAYDPVGGGCLLFGGRTGLAIYSDTWRWDGHAWTQLSPTGSPPGGEGVRMATDWVRGRVVLAPSNGTTWEWDGSGWSSIVHGGSNPGRVPMTFDDGRGRVVALSGGSLWEWDGNSWSAFAGAGPVPNRYDHVLAHDPVRGCTIVCGGVVSGNYAGDLWEWDGASWQARPGIPAASGRSVHAGVFDSQRGRMVVFGGRNWRGNHADTWEWDGAQWHGLAPAPVESTDCAMAGDAIAGRILLVSTGGSGQTFEWRDGGWLEHRPATMPAGDRRGAMAFDSARGTFVYFGGSLGAANYGDTYEWTQGNWQNRNLNGPPARSSHAMAYDPSRQRIVVFGGRSTARILDDTWEFDGAQWQQAAPATVPSWRELSGLAFDPILGEMLMFGGLRGYQTLGDTWTWDGVDWVQHGSTWPREDFAMCLDPVRGRVVRHGGYRRQSGASMGYDDTWEWNGTSWSMLASGGTSISRRAAMASDGRDLVLFGGITTGGNANDPLAETAVLSRRPSAVASYGTGCSGSAPAVGIDSHGVPRTGNDAFGLTVFDTRPRARCWVGVSSASANQQFLGCTILVQPWIGAVTAVSSEAGVARVPLPLPYAPSLVGLRFYLQGFVDEPRGTIVGLAFTHGLRITIGN